jgi:uncharacterized membrane protein
MMSFLVFTLNMIKELKLIDMEPFNLTSYVALLELAMLICTLILLYTELLNIIAKFYLTQILLFLPAEACII